MNQSHCPSQLPSGHEQRQADDAKAREKTNTESQITRRHMELITVYLEQKQRLFWNFYQKLLNFWWIITSM